MKKYSILLFFVVMLSCTKHTSHNLSNNKCQNLKTFVKSIWKYNKAEDFYYVVTGKELVFEKQMECLLGKTSWQVIDILGCPHIRTYKACTYHVDRRCNERPQRYCRTLSIALDKDAKVSRVMFLVNEDEK